MELKLGSTSSENERVDKDFNTILSLNGSLREKTNVINPSIRINATNPTTCNYAYIPEFHRYYYIKSFDNVQNNIWVVNLEVDPLKSFSSEIKSLIASIDKQENNNNKVTNKMINDGTFINPEDEAIDVLTFENGETLLNYNENGKETYHYIMVHI